jgi:hypothetical protein
MTCFGSIYLNCYNVKEQAREGEENGDKIHKYYRWGRNREETWKGYKYEML